MKKYKLLDKNDKLDLIEMNHFSLSKSTIMSRKASYWLRVLAIYTALIKDLYPQY